MTRSQPSARGPQHWVSSHRPASSHPISGRLPGPGCRPTNLLVPRPFGIQQRWMSGTAGGLRAPLHARVVTDSVFHVLLHILPLNTQSTQQICVCIKWILFPFQATLYLALDSQRTELGMHDSFAVDVCGWLFPKTEYLANILSQRTILRPQRHLRAQK